MRGAGLAAARDVVELALDRQQSGVADVLRPDQFQLALRVAHFPGAVDQLEVLEHRLDGLEVIVGVHVEHGVVLVVELAMRLGAVVVTLDQVIEIVVMAVGVAVRVHRDEAGMLQETWIDPAAGPREVVRHPVDHVVLEPLEGAVHREVVDLGRRLARIDGAAHHGHRQRRLLAAAGHQRDGGQRRHGRLADADDMAVVVAALQVVDEVLQVVDVVVEVELALGQRHQARVLPLGDVDLVVLEHGAHGLAQQGRIVARQGSDDQHHRLALEAGERLGIVAEALEAQQVAEGLGHLDPFLDRDLHPVDVDGADAELGLFVVLAQAVHQVEAGGQALRHRRHADRQHRVGEHLGRHLGQVGERLDQ